MASQRWLCRLRRRDVIRACNELTLFSNGLYYRRGVGELQSRLPALVPDPDLAAHSSAAGSGSILCIRDHYRVLRYAEPCVTPRECLLNGSPATAAAAIGWCHQRLWFPSYVAPILERPAAFTHAYRRGAVWRKERPMQHGNGDTIPTQIELPIEQPIPITKS